MFICQVISGIVITSAVGISGIYLYKKSDLAKDKTSLIFDTSVIEKDDIEMLPEVQDDLDSLIPNFETNGPEVFAGNIYPNTTQSKSLQNQQKKIDPNKLFYILTVQKENDTNSCVENCEWSFQEKQDNNQMQKIDFSSLIFYETTMKNPLSISKNYLKKLENNTHLLNNNNSQYVIELNREDDNKWLLKQQSIPKKDTYITYGDIKMAKVLRRTQITVN